MHQQGLNNTMCCAVVQCCESSCPMCRFYMTSEELRWTHFRYTGNTEQAFSRNPLANTTREEEEEEEYNSNQET